MLKKIFWGIIALLGAFAFAVVSKIIYPQEHINAIWMLVAAACLYLIAYRFYSVFIASKLFHLNDKNQTPSNLFSDGHDYDPTNKWMLFGHHFAAIAGAGPLIGPILAAQFGYMPGMLWILLGAVMAGAVHDFIILVMSIRRNGKSIADIAKAEIGKLTGITTSIATFFIIIVAMAGLGIVVVKALAHSAWGTFTLGATIPIALLMGFYLRKFRPGKIGEVSVIGVILLLAAVIFGKTVQDSSIAHYFIFSEKSLTLILAGYGFIASILPVWMLLAPRDHLSTYLKIGTIGMLSLGIFYVSPHIVFPAVTQFVHGGGPIIQGALFPYLFITIACGAISGFHALISSGTTSKMLQKESDARPIAYGGMIVEGFVSLTALIAAVTLSPGDYFYINSSLPDGAMAALGFLPDKIHMFESEIGISLAHRTGGAVTLAVGMANILSGIPFMKSLIAYWYNFALMFEALFILTTIDAGTRVARFLLQDAIGDIYKPMKNYSWLPGTLITSAIVVLLWGSLIWTGSVSTIWPMFGISNQLLAGIALTVATSVLIKMKKIRYIWVTVIPMVFLLVVTLTASVLEVTKYIGLLKQPNLSHQLHITYVFNTILIAFMALLALVIVIDNVRKWGVFSKTPYIEPLSGGERGSTPSLHEELSLDKETIGQILKEKPVFATEEATTVDE